MKEKVKVLLLTILLLLFCLFLSENQIVLYGNWFYLVQLAVITIVIFKQKNNYLFFLSPSYIALSYLNLSYFFGHYVVSRGLGFELMYHYAFNNYESLKFITSFFLICNLMVFLSLNFKKISRYDYVVTFNKDREKVWKLIFLFGLLLFLNFVKIDFEVIGGKGDFSYVFKLAVSIFIVILLSEYKLKIKYILYSVLLFIFIVGSYDSKREILFVIILILYFELIRNKININFLFKHVLFLIIIALSIFYIVIVSSIMRGYGNFDVDNPYDATKYIVEYLESDYIQDALTANFELSTTYGNTSNAVDYVYKGEVDFLYGSTFTKILFSPIPRSLYPDKPQSLIDIYTSKFFPEFRNIGGSLPVGIYGESFWNFSLFCFPFIFLFFKLINKFYFFSIKYVANLRVNPVSIFVIYIYITFIQFVRGSGLDLWLLYALLSLPLILILNFLVNLNKKIFFSNQ